MRQNGISVRPAMVLRWLIGVITVLLLLSLTVSVLAWPFGHDHLFGLAAKFRVAGERNIPTYFAAAQLALAAVLLALTASWHVAAATGEGRPWSVLAVGFAAMSMEEIAGLHEYSSSLVYDALGIEGASAFHFAWVVPALLLVALLALYFVRFLLAQPSRTRNLFVLSGVLFVGGAVGMEMVGGYYQSIQSQPLILGTATYFVYDMIATLEEALEFFAIAIFIYALLDYCERRLGEVRIRFGHGPAPAE
ncbi:MAG: hypothetical protein RIM84_19225 [Alphaproteobacteria bacterium]